MLAIRNNIKEKSENKLIQLGFKILFLIIFSFSIFGSYAQEQQYFRKSFKRINDYYTKFDIINSDYGLSDNNVHCIFQDKYGYMWFGTEDGLNKYDGYDITIFKNIKNDSNSLSGNFINCITEDIYGNLWIGTRNGLCKYNRKTNNFTQFNAKNTSSNTLQNSHITSLLADSTGYLWIDTYGGFLHKLNIKNKSFTHYQYITSNIITYPQNELFMDGDSIWIIKIDNSSAIFNKKSKSFIYMKDIDITTDAKTGVYDNHTSILKDGNGNYYFGNAHNYLLCYQPKEMKAHMIKLPSIYTLKNDNKGNIWLGGFSVGLLKYNIKKNTITQYKSADNNPWSMPNNQVWDIFIDKANSIWIATNNGVAKLSAKNNKFQHIRNIANNANTIISNNVKDIIQAKDSTLWVSTIAGLSNINLKNNIVNHYTQENNSLIHNKINNLYEDKDGIIWIGGWHGHGFNSYNPLTKKFSKHVFDPYQNGSDWYVGFAENNHNKFYAVMWGGGGFAEFNRKTNKFTYKAYFDAFNNKGKSVKSLSYYKSKLWNNEFCYNNLHTGASFRFMPKKYYSDLTYSKIYSNKNSYNEININIDGRVNFETTINGVLYFATNHGLYKYIEESNTIIKVFSKDINVISIAKSDKENFIWIGTNDGLLLINTITNKEILYYNKTNSKLKDNYINTLHFTENQILWIGTKTDLYKLQINNDSKNKIQLIDNEYTNCNIIDITEADNYIWVACEQGLNRINPNNDRIINYSLSNCNISSNTIYTLHTDKNGTLWVATANGLNRYNAKKNDFTIWKHKPSDPNSIVDNKIYSITEDDSANIFLGTDRGISTFNTLSNKVKLLKTFDNKHLYYGLLSYAYTDTKGEIWIGLYNSNAVDKFNSNNSSFTHFIDYSYDSTSYKGSITNFIYEDSKGTIWVGSDKGLNRYNKQNNNFTTYTINDGLPTNNICGILEDNSHSYWLSTSKGLVHFNANNGIINTYTKKDGLQSNSFSEGAFCKLFDGRLAFAGDRGITIFNPNSIKISNKNINPIFTKFLVFDSLYYGDLSTIHNIDLSYYQNNFQVEFSVLEFIKPEKHKYKYKLIGYDNDWLITDYRNRKAKYANLPYGKYTLLLRATNSDGIWSNKEARINIYLIPPFWHTNLAYVGYFIIFISIIVLIIKLRTKQIKDKNKQLEIAVSERTKEVLEKNEELTEQKIADLLKRHQLDSIKDKISGEEKERRRLASELHDGIGGSIAGIKLYLENMLKKEESPELKAILEDIKKAYLEIRTISHDLVPPEFEYSSIMEVVSSYINQVKIRSNINISLDIFPQTGWNNIEDKLQVEIYRIIQELMTNALKHAKASEIDIQLVLHKELINISIEDNGVGINKDMIKKGIGLSNIKNRISRLNGKLNIENSIEGGTMINIDIPLVI